MAPENEENGGTFRKSVQSGGFRLKDQWNVLAAGNDECWVVGKVSWVCTAEPDPRSRMLNITLSAQPFSFLFLQVLKTA